MTHATPPSASSADNSLAQFLRLWQQLHACSNEELEGQLHQIACAQPTQLVHSLRFLLHSSQYVHQQLGPRAEASATPNPSTPLFALFSAREREVLSLLAKGYTMPRIGKRLFISPATVNNHCANMREKLGLRGRNALMRYAAGLKNE